MPQDLEKIVLGVAVDRAYSDELKLLWRILVISKTIRQGVRNGGERYYRRMYKRGRYMVDEDMRTC